MSTTHAGLSIGSSRIFGDWFLIKGIAGFKVKTKKKIGKNQKG